MGSAKRNLFIRYHTQGFDCDYQILITRNANNLEPFEIKKLFMQELNRVVILDGYKRCEDNQSSLTIKNIGKNDKILNSYYVVILQDSYEGIKILRNRKVLLNKKYYIFELLPNMERYREKFLMIKGNEMLESLRDIYYKKKQKS